MDTEGPCDDPNNKSILSTWEKVDKAMDKLFIDNTRNHFPDTNGMPFKIGWFFLSWTGFIENPRNRDFGYHKVRDHYLSRWGALLKKYGDEHCWHYHHPAKSKVGNEWGLDWDANREYSNIISKQIIDRKWFPISFRAGGTIHTSKSSAWVDDWFPFDYSNRSPIKIEGLVDWSRAIDNWSIYRPDKFVFSRRGNGKRFIARSLDLSTNIYSINDYEIEKAFIRAQGGQPSIISVFDHDYRDIEERIKNFLNRIENISNRYPNIQIEYANPSEAIIKSLSIERFPTSIFVEAAVHNNKLRIWTTSPIYQTIPWIALEGKTGDISQLTDNVVRCSPTSWECDLSRIKDYKKIGIGVSTLNGLSDVFIINNQEKLFGDFFNKEIKRHPQNPYSLNEHSKAYPQLLIGRATGELPEMDSISQLHNILVDKKLHNCSLLDVGCGAGQIFRMTKQLGIDYHGIDEFQRGIELGKLILSNQGLDCTKLRNITVFQLHEEERFDVVVNLFNFRYVQQYEPILEAMAIVANKYLIIRAPSFSKRTIKRYYPDVLLDTKFQTLKSFFNLYSEKHIEKYLSNQGFSVNWVSDRRQKTLFKGKSEVVGGISFYYKFLVAKRINRRPNRNELLGKYWMKHAELWTSKKRGIPNTKI